MNRGLVLGGGGVGGIAWMTGLLLGLEERGIALRQADRLIGTSAGATVAAQLCSRLDLAALYARQTDPALQVAELVPQPHLLTLLSHSFPVLMALGDPAERARRIGGLALESETVPEATRRAVIAARLPDHEWGERRLSVVAVNAGDGTTRLFDRTSGVGLVDAVAASCAVPGLWPPVSLQGSRYMDGGIRSSDNADLAAGMSRVVVLSPLGRNGPGDLELQEKAIAASGGMSRVIEPDGPSREAIGSNPLSPDIRRPAALAGRRQGQLLEPSLASFWADA